MSLPETQKRDQRRRQTAAEIKKRRACKHEWKPLWSLQGEKHRRASRGAWKRYCELCDSYSR